MAVIQLKRRIPGTGAPASGTAANQVRIGELATSISALGATGVAELYIGDGTYVHDLVSAARQVELEGAQTITGVKTIDTGGSITVTNGGITVPVANLHIGNGTNGQVLSTNGSGTNSWITLPEGLVTTFDPADTYAIGDFVIHSGHMYRAKVAVPAGAWDGDDWDRIVNMDDLEDYLPLAGGTLSGNLIFSGAPGAITSTGVLNITPATLTLNPTTALNFTPSANGNIAATTSGTGTITLTSAASVNLASAQVLLQSDPTVALGAVTKQYADAHSPAQRFSATATYAVGDFIYHNGHLYRANSAVPAGAFDQDDWDQVATLADLPVIEAGGTAPAAPNTAGDLWYNTTTNQLMIYNGTAWEMVAGVWVQAAAPAGQPEGALWLNSTTNVLSVYNGTAWVGASGNRGSFGAAGHANPVAGDIWYSSTGPQYWSGTAWTAVTLPGFAGVATVAPISGDGNTGTELGLTMANAGQINGGTDTVYPIDSAGLRTNVLGGVNGVASLNTTNKLVVPAINELHTAVTAVTGAVRFVGNFDADDSEVTTAATGTLTVGANLPTAATTNEGWYVIVVNAGTPTAPAPTQEMQAGDWIVSTGAQWIHVPLYHAAMTAANVAITTINAQTWANVQAALDGLYTRSTTAGNTAVLADHTSILGDGTSATATDTVGTLRVGLVDGGTF